MDGDYKRKVKTRDVRIQTKPIADTFNGHSIISSRPIINTQGANQSESITIPSHNEMTYNEPYLKREKTRLKNKKEVPPVGYERMDSDQETIIISFEMKNNPLPKSGVTQLVSNDEETVDQRHRALTFNDLNNIANEADVRERRVVEPTVEEQNLTVANTTNNVQVDLGPLIEYAEEPLLPLAEACAPLNDILHDLSSYVQMALEETPQEPLDGLTIDESAAIRLYSIEWKRPHRSLYSMLNYTLKTADRAELRPYFKYMKLFLTALAKLPCVPPLTVWRGVTKNLSAEFPPGTPVTWWSFSSCTTELTVLENNMYLGNQGDRTLFSVEVINGRTIRAHSHFVTEEEILLLPGTYMIVQSLFSPAPALHIVHLKQVIPEETLLAVPFEGAHLYPKIRRSWYRKKRNVIPMCLLTLLCLIAVIIGCVFGLRSTLKTPAYVCMEPYPDASSFGVGTSPVSMVVGDFNNDNKLDLGVLTSDTFAVYVLFGNNKGTFPSELTFKTDAHPYIVIAADFNRDNIKDLAVSNEGDNAISVLIGNADASFAFQTRYIAGHAVGCVIASDFNNDTFLDLMTTSLEDGTISLLLGYGDGTFASQLVYAVGNRPRSVISGDFNGDGKLDASVTNQNDNTISVLLGNGDGTFGNSATYLAGQVVEALISYDFNNDAILDIAVANFIDNTIGLLLGNGDGTFQGQTTINSGGGPNSLKAADFNNDEIIDLVVPFWIANGVGVYMGNGDGTFQNYVLYATGSSASGVVAADFNHDNCTDMVVTNYEETTISVLINRGDGTFNPQIKYAVGMLPRSVISYDIDGNGDMDLVIICLGDVKNYILFGNGDGLFQGRVPYATGKTSSFMTSGYFNNDKLLDLVLINNDNSISIAFGSGTGGFHNQVNYGLQQTANFLITADFNNDTKLDLVLANQNNNSITILLANRDGTFKTGNQINIPVGNQPISIATGYFNNDNLLDLVVTNYYGKNVSVLFGNGNGTFQPHVMYRTGVNPEYVIPIDFNNDNATDLVVAHQGENTIGLLLGDKSGTFPTLLKYKVDKEPSALVSSDFNRDNKIDIAVINEGSNDITILFGAGTATISFQRTYTTHIWPSSLVTADFNKDGKIDLAVTNRDSNDMTIFLNACQ